MTAEMIGKFIKHRREELGYTTRTLGEKIGVSYYIVESWESGRATPEMEHLLDLASALDVEVEELLRGKENENYSVETKVRKKNEKSFYDEFHEKYGYERGTLPPEAQTNYDSDPDEGNGFFPVERSFGYVICTVLLIIFIVANVMHFNRLYNLPIQIDSSNYEQYLDVSVTSTSMHKATYNITVKNKDRYVICDLEMNIELNVKNAPYFPYHEYVDETKIVEISCKELKSGETIVENIEFSYSNVILEENIKVVSVTGRT